MKEILKEFEYLPRLSSFVITHGMMFQIEDEYDLEKFEKDVFKYTDLITQPLTKGMFVPCDEDGNVIDRSFNAGMINPLHYKYDYDFATKYQKALDRVIFEGEWEWTVSWIETLDQSIELEAYETIEDAINAGVKLKYK